MVALDAYANLNFSGFGLTAYYFDGHAVGWRRMLNYGYDSLGNPRDSNGGYVQGTYTLPSLGTKLGVSWGKSILDLSGAEAPNFHMVNETPMWTIGAYHPLTKNINLVAEYSDIRHKWHDNLVFRQDTIALGAIMFF